MWRWILVPVGIVLVLSASVSITWAGIWAPVSEEFIAQLRTQLREAIAAADLAQKSKQPEARQLLLHVINCLEGPNSQNYFNNVADRCKGHGHGILPDLRRLWGARGKNKMAPKYDVALRSADEAWFAAMRGAEEPEQMIQRWAKIVSLLLQAALEGVGQ